MASGKEPFTWRKEALPQRESAPRLVCVVLDAETAGEKARSTFLTTEQVGSSSAHLVVFISSIVFQDRYSFGTDVSGSQYRPKVPAHTTFSSKNNAQAQEDRSRSTPQLADILGYLLERAQSVVQRSVHSSTQA